MTPSSCLNPGSCSSSTIIRPRSENGSQSADLAPTIIEIVPSAAARQVALRWCWLISECQTPGLTPKRSSKRVNHCVDRAISGRRIKDCFPEVIADTRASKYTSVLPDQSFLTGDSSSYNYFEGDSADEFIGGMRSLVEDLVHEVISSNPSITKLYCPKCEVGSIVKGKSAFGCTEWINGCSFQIPFQNNGIQIDGKLASKLITQRKVNLTPNQNGTNRVAYLKEDFTTEIRTEKPLNLKCPKCKSGFMRKGKTAYGCSEFKKTCDFLIPFSLLPEETSNKDVIKFLAEKEIQTTKRILKLTHDFGIETN